MGALTVKFAGRQERLPRRIQRISILGKRLIVWDAEECWQTYLGEIDFYPKAEKTLSKKLDEFRRQD